MALMKSKIREILERFTNGYYGVDYDTGEPKTKMERHIEERLFDKLEKELINFTDDLSTVPGSNNDESWQNNRILLDDKGDIDEIVELNTTVHLERMDDDYLFMTIGGEKIRLHIISDSKITINKEH